MTRIFAVVLSCVLSFTLAFEGGALSGPGSGWPVQTDLLAQSASTQAKAGAPAPITSALRNEKGSVKFGVLGDTGTGGTPQREIGRLLDAARQRFGYEFVIMLGDNMYGGENPSDFVRKFEAPYKPILSAGVKFYAALGNHDEPAQRFYPAFNMDGKRYYTFKKDDVEFFVLDTTQLDPPHVKWVEEALSKSTAKWKIPYFHHPLYSSGDKHGSEADMRAILEPLFVRYGVDVVFAGHEHFYERLKPRKGIHYFTAGGSAKLRKNNINTKSPLTAKGFDTDRSFMLVEIDKDEMLFDAISRKGQIVDSGVITHRRAAAAAEQLSSLN